MKENKKEKIYTREALLKSKRFSHIQRDFLKAILNKDSYTISEAAADIAKVFGGDR